MSVVAGDYCETFLIVKNLPATRLVKAWGRAYLPAQNAKRAMRFKSIDSKLAQALISGQ